MTIGAIVLAAGSSRRFGDDKRKSLLGSGKTILATSIENVASCFDEVLVVLRSGDHDFGSVLESSLSDPAITFYCAPDSAKGMAHSLANAIHQVKNWNAAAILLGDMPFLKQETIGLLLTSYSQSEGQQPIVIPTKDGTHGHPVIFHHRYFADIEKLEGDTGARAVIQANLDKVIEVPVDDEGIVRDIDTPEDI